MDDVKNSCSLASSDGRAGIVGDEVVDKFQFVSFAIFVNVIGVSGMIANIINIVIFVKIGLHDSVNITLFSLSLSDLFLLIAMVGYGASFNPLWELADLNFCPTELAQFSAGWLVFYFSRVTNSITAFLIFIRCLCVTLPFRIKNIVTPKRTWVIIGLIYIIMGMTAMPILLMGEYRYVFNVARNKTMLRLVMFKDNTDSKSAFSVLATIFYGFPMVWIIVCTVTLIVSLKYSSALRGKMVGAGTNGSGRMSNREKHVSRVVVFVVIIYIACSFPYTIQCVAVIFVRDFSPKSHLSDLYIMTLAICEICMAISATVNTAVYIAMSSKYRETFLRTFS